MGIVPDKKTGYRFGIVVGIIAASVFVWVNQGALPGISRVSSIVAWAVLLIVTVWLTWVKGSEGGGSGQARPEAMKIYGISCGLMVVGFIAASFILSQFNAIHAMPAAVALIVGLHFLPFSSAFQVPFFKLLGLAMAVVGATGVVFALVLGAPWGAGGAVTAGIVMLALQVWDGTKGIRT